MEKRGLKVAILFEDEWFVELRIRLRRAWAREKKLTARCWVSKNDKIAVFGSVDVEGLVILHTAKTANTNEFQAWVTKARETYNNYYVIYIILDNVSYHTVVRNLPI
ncbi:MAG: transposase [Candidatus Jordarchaeum sp.]|uniref:transposase n=1 Tax=Candidatus Jordarchaeum sp. TaxID=2823881 RepID=UPI00404978C6